MAVIGRFQAVAMVGKRELSGLIAWFVWLAIHLMEITLFSNRILVMIQWGSTFLLRNHSARLITYESVMVSNEPSETETPA
jgi:NADH dehydrogenase